MPFFGFFYIRDLGVYFTFYFCVEKCFDPWLKREQVGWCNLFWDKDSKENEQEIITESPIKNLWKWG